MQEDVRAKRRAHEQLEYAKRHLEAKVATFRGQTEEKLKEIDTLYEENDKLRADLSHLRYKYNFDKIDQDKENLLVYENWIALGQGIISDMQVVYQTHFQCQICSGIAINPQICEPCNHVYCRQCMDNQREMHRCKLCQQPIERKYMSLLVNQFLDNYEPVILESEKIMHKLKKIQQ